MHSCNPRSSAGRALVLAAMVAIVAVSAPVFAAPPDGATLEQFRQNPMSFFFELRTADLVQCGQAVLEGSAQFSPAERKDALTALAATYLATGKDAPARAAVLGILADDASANLSRPEELPPPLVQLFYGLRDSLLLVSGDTGRPEILTLAVGDIENNSIVAGKYDMDRFARGLTHIITSDLRGATPFKLVDRQRLAVLRDELEMSRNDQVTDPRYAVPLGRLSGAQSFLFGSLMQVEKNRVRLDIRWVDTSTSEILLSEGIEAKLSSSEDLFNLQRKLLLEVLAPKMEAWLQGKGQGEKVIERARPYIEERKKSVGGKTAYLEYLSQAGAALLAEERGDLAAAQTAWEEASKHLPADLYAAGRTKVYDAQFALAGAGQE